LFSQAEIVRLQSDLQTRSLAVELLLNKLHVFMRACEADISLVPSPRLAACRYLLIVGASWRPKGYEYRFNLLPEISSAQADFQVVLLEEAKTDTPNWRYSLYRTNKNSASQISVLVKQMVDKTYKGATELKPVISLAKMPASKGRSLDF
jgi:hypothetical protein